ncbi:MAG: class A beta-lactamase-related serine hydrolase [Candidatus Roizmanbacteria bacterium]|nr:class A beta-lactamase-related serine hydrolase [Candidatus Roizmanbacteria bacterium]
MSTVRALHLVFLIAGIAIGVLITTVIYPPTQSTVSNLIEQRALGKYTSPLLECDAFEPLPPQQLAKLKRAINNIKKSYESRAIISLYVRGLANGGAIVFEEKDTEFDAASLMKLPVYIALMKRIELKPELVDVKLTAYEGSLPEQNIEGGTPVKPGEELTINEFIERAIIDSDNRAIKTLRDYIGMYAINDVLRDHGLVSADAQESYQITPQEYSAFLRVLYNATYLKTESSEKVLQMLTQSKFERGIRSGVPNDIPIAHKFGEQTVDSPLGRSYELHDCGIVYSSRPYVICIMTKGESFDLLYKIMRTVSSKTYAVMNSED